MKKLIACLLVCLLVITFNAPVVLAHPAMPPLIHHAGKNPSFWMKYGRFALGLGIALCIVAELSHDKTEKTKQGH